MEYVVFFLLVLVLLIAYAIKAFYDQKKDEQRFLEKLDQKYGTRPTREYEYAEFDNITHYFEKVKKEAFHIDDITWNDLDMDTIFMLINQTQSSAGDQYLYKLLRMPCFDEESLLERERLITYFMSHKEERKKLQVLFHKLGRLNKISLSDYLDNLLDLPQRKNLPHYIMIGVIIAAAVSILIIPQVGILLFIASLSYNVINYFKEKRESELYILTLSYILRLLKLTKEIDALKIKDIESYTTQMNKAAKKFNKFKKNSYIVISGASLGGSIEDVIMDYFRMMFHFDIIKFNSMLKEVNKYKNEIACIVENIGILESMISIGSFRNYLPFYCIPNLNAKKDAEITAEELYHPMIENPVLNSITVNSGVLVTGSNASGKSTFLKTVAINAILSQTTYTSMAKYYAGNYFTIYSSMSLRDNLENNESYYMVEIKSLKRILDAEHDKYPILCFVDEVLRGTNTVERIAASTQILKSLSKEDILCFAATHDIELTYLLEEHYNNFHFEEEVLDDDVVFNYKLMKGRATTRNAIKLLSIIGYDEKIIEEAKKSADRFAKTGEWSL